MNDRIRPDLNRPPVQHVGEHRVRALSLSGLRDLLRDYGVDHRPILDEAGLSLDHGDDLAWISLERFIRALTLAARVTGDRYFGLKHGTRGRFTANPLGYLMANSPDLRTGLRNYARFQSVLATNHLEFVETAGAGRIEFSYPVTIPNAVQMTDFVLMRFVSRIRTRSEATGARFPSASCIGNPPTSPNTRGTSDLAFCSTSRSTRSRSPRQRSLSPCPMPTRSCSIS